MQTEPRMGLEEMAWPGLAEQISGVCQGRRPVGQYLKLKWGHGSKERIQGRRCGTGAWPLCPHLDGHSERRGEARMVLETNPHEIDAFCPDKGSGRGRCISHRAAFVEDVVVGTDWGRREAGSGGQKGFSSVEEQSGR